MKKRIREEVTWRKRKKVENTPRKQREKVMRLEKYDLLFLGVLLERFIRIVY